MNASALPKALGESQRLLTSAIRKLAEVWIAACDEFRQRERRDIIEAEPSGRKLAEYRVDLKWMLRSGRSILNLISDPEYPQPQHLPEISGKILQLESSLKSLDNMMTETEAEALLKEAFPDDPLIQKFNLDEKRTGSAP